MAKRDFECFLPGQHLNSLLRFDEVEKTYIILRDLRPDRTKNLLLMPYHQGTMLLEVRNKLSGNRMIAKVIFDHVGNTEKQNQDALTRLAHNRLPNIIETNFHVSRNYVDTADRVDVILMEKGYEFEEYHNAVLAEEIDRYEEVEMSLAFQLLYGMHFMHMNLFQHRDLRMENVVFSMEKACDYAQYHTENDVVFQVPTKFGSFSYVPKWIDFGLTANLNDDGQREVITGYISPHRPPKFIFAIPGREVTIENSDELFAFGMALFYLLEDGMKKFPFSKTRKHQLVDMFKELKTGLLFDLYRGYTAEELAFQAATYVLLLGFPADTHPTFYKTHVGLILHDMREELEQHRLYNYLLKTKGRVAHPLFNLIRKLLRWEGQKQYTSVLEILRSSCFTHFRAHVTPAFPQWGAIE